MSSPKATQDFVPIKEVRDGVLILKDNSLRSILIASSLNFSLKSEEERNAILYQFQDFLNSLDFPVQIYIQSRRLDIRPYLALLVEIKKAEEIVIQKNEEVNQKNLILEQKVQEINKNNEPIPNQFAGVEGVKHDDVNVVVDVNIESNKIEIKQEETTSSVVPDVKIQIDEKSTVPVNIAEKPKEEIEKSNDLTKVVSNEESDFSPSVEFKKLDEKVLDLASRKQYLDIDLEDFIGVLLHEKLTNLFNDLDSKHLDAFSLEPVYNTLFGYISNPHEEKIDLINKQLEALGKLMGEGFANDDIGESEYHLALNVTDPCHDNAILVKMPPVPKIDSIDKEIISINS
jgi:hypothetical protein